mgnify:CR=1 FL=1
MIQANGDGKVKVTNKGLAEKLGLEYQSAVGLMTVLKEKGLATDTGEVEKGSGPRGSKVYEIPSSFTVTISQ